MQPFSMLCFPAAGALLVDGLGAGLGGKAVGVLVGVLLYVVVGGKAVDVVCWCVGALVS